MRLSNPKRRNMPTQLLMSFLEISPPAGSAPVWTALDEDQQAEVEATLGRLIARVATAPDSTHADDGQEADDE